MLSNEIPDIAKSISKCFQKRSPIHTFLSNDGQTLTFIGFKKGRPSELAAANVEIEGSHLSRASSGARIELVRELRGVGHNVSVGADVPYAFKRAFVQMPDWGGRDEQ